MNLESILGLEFQNPVWLLLLALVGIGFLGGAGAYYIKKAFPPDTPLFMSVRERMGLAASRWFHKIPKLLRCAALLILVFALTDVTRSYVTSVQRAKKQRIINTLDTSGSMWDWPTPPGYSSINCNRNDRPFKRIYGACRAMHRMVDEVEIVAKSTSDSEHLIGIIQFAVTSAVISYPTNNYAGLREKIDAIEFYTDSHGLGLGTGMSGAIWNMFLMALDRNFKNESGFTFLDGKDMDELARILNPASIGSPIAPSDALRDKLVRIREEIKDTVFIMLTDAVVQYLAPQMYSEYYGVPFSLERELKLAEFLELPVFFISTDEFYPYLKVLAMRTGYGPEGSGTRGDFLMARQEDDFANMQDLMSTILKHRFSQTVPIEVRQRESYSEFLVFLALTFIAASVVWKKLLTRSLTELE